MTAGFLSVDKPSGITSHDVVDRVRRATGIRKVGHTGTLDPMATGVVVVAIGAVTRLIRFLQDLDKEYVATARFGVATDTLDADGVVVEEIEMAVDRAAVEAAASGFVGIVEQVPPMVSALKKDGERLYEMARRGEEVEREARPVAIHELEILDVTDGPSVTFRVVCGKGTYVRTLADDIARALGGRAHLTALRRTRNGVMHVDDALPVDRLDEWRERLVSPLEALGFLPRVTVDEAGARAVSNGRPIPLTVPMLPGPVAVVAEGRLLAVYTADGEVGRSEVVLA